MKASNASDAAGVNTNGSNDDNRHDSNNIAVASPTKQPSGSDPKQSDDKNRNISPSPRRRSNRDVNSIRLNGVGKTAHTFYRRMRTLFFSNPSREEYECLFVNGSRRRKRRSKNNSESRADFGGGTDASASVTATTSKKDSIPPDEREKIIRVERVTKPDEASIYVIDNFLSEKELEYFDEKIRSIPFERSFVDNMGYNDENDDDDDDDENDNGDSNIDNDGANDNRDHSVPNGALGGEEKKSRVDDAASDSASGSASGSASQAKNQTIATGDKHSESRAVISDAKKTGKKRKKRKRKTLVDDSHRTSTFYSFRKLHDAKISALERRIANILGCWVHQIEALQLVRYVPGQFFGIHHDLGNLLEDDNVELPPKDWASKRRLVTMFCYLNTLQEDEGGCTYFPKCSDLRVQPKRGRAVLWCNITQDGKPDATTIHAGEVVTMTAGKVAASGTCSSIRKAANETRGHPAAATNNSIDTKSKSKSKAVATKYGLNIWVCEE